MIRGKIRKNYNDFEEQMFCLSGFIEDGVGLAFFFEHIYQTFEYVENASLMHSFESKLSFEKEDYHTRQSLYLHDPQYKIDRNPLLTTLHNSHFITLHSEFEKTWDEVVEIYNRYFPKRKKIPISNSYFTDPTFNSSCLLDKVLNNHKILASYNFIRNKIIHGFSCSSSIEYQTVKTQIDSSLINHIRAIEVRDRAFFQIANIKFCKEYGDAVLSFIKDIGETSFTDRT